jgi:triacylglycerol lipase
MTILIMMVNSWAFADSVELRTNTISNPLGGDMEALSPKEAVSIADRVYGLKDANIDEVAGIGLNNPFFVQGAKRFEGVTGISTFKSQSGFGYVAKGQGTRTGEVLIAIRGTVDLTDWITDLNVGFEKGPSGDKVHAGFLRSFNSFKKDIDTALNKIGSSAVHVVGHSLGGALANLTADYAKQRGVEVKVYTFGAPRTVMNAVNMTRKLGEENIYRVYHTADPVSMVPIFPFQPMPVTNWGYFMLWNGPVVAAPHLRKNYVNSVGNMKWPGIYAHVTSSKSWWEHQTKEWLEKASSSHYISMGSSVTLWVILLALENVINSINATINCAVIGGFTALDRLAELLYAGTLQSVKIAGQVRRILSGVMKFTGRVVDATTYITVSFIRWVLETLFRVISTAALKAVHAAMEL